MYRKMCILCQQTSPKRWFGNRTMTSNCDVTNSAHQIQMTTLCHWMNPPMKSFCVRHWMNAKQGLMPPIPSKFHKSFQSRRQAFASISRKCIWAFLRNYFREMDYREYRNRTLSGHRLIMHMNLRSHCAPAVL